MPEAGPWGRALARQRVTQCSKELVARAEAVEHRLAIGQLAGRAMFPSFGLNDS
jgi:hypothetical protein